MTAATVLVYLYLLLRTSFRNPKNVFKTSVNARPDCPSTPPLQRTRSRLNRHNRSTGLVTALLKMHYLGEKLGQNRGTGHLILTLNESFLTLRAPNLCTKFHSNRKNCDRRSAGRHTDRQTHRQTEGRKIFYNLTHIVCYNNGTGSN